jgi:hypothetical protein
VFESIRGEGPRAEQTYDPPVSDAEHERLLDNSEQAAEIARLRAVGLRAAPAAIAAQDRADGTHEPRLDDLVRDLGAPSEA